LGLEQRYDDNFADAIPLEFGLVEPHAAIGHLSAAIKRAIDVAAAVILLLTLSPIFLLTAILIRLDSTGPVLFRQTRLGLWGQPFFILKFRTMRVLEDGEFVVQATSNDPRVTRIGRILRKTSIDELPQLINVLKGEMSLVGPRPHARIHDEYYTHQIANYTVRQHVKPGITGWAQVNGFRGETPTLSSMRQRVLCDIWYVLNFSLLLYLKILLSTPFELLHRRNAH